MDNTSNQPSDAPRSVNAIEVQDPDLAAPSIDHTPIEDGREPGLTVEVSADITDPSGVVSATLFYRPVGGAFTSTPMMASGRTWSASVPAAAVTTAGVEYYLTADDLCGTV